MFSSKSLITLAILLACGTIAVSARDCLKACTREYNPVCATNGKEYKLLSNPCVMDIFNCEHDFKWTRAKSLDLCSQAVPFVEDSKKDCYKPCTFEYQPVCGFNGERYQVFGNQCSMENAHCDDGKVWTISNFNNCEEPQQVNEVAPIKIDDCIRPCGVEYSPICMFDGVHYELFDNVCEVHNAECGTNKHYRPAPFVACVVPPMTAAKKDCNKPCPRIYAPVCATDGQTYHIFDNKCLMEADAECYAHNWHIAPLSVCENPIPLAAAPKEEFVTPCPFIYAPVCATDGQTYHIFDNKCLMEADAKFNHRNWHIAPLNVCENPIPLAEAPKKDCNKPCPFIYAPVCATDGQTYHIFDNKCMMEADAECYAHNWHIAPLSVCENPIPLAAAPKEEFITPCPLIYAPVCATDGQTYHIFDNKCLMEADAKFHHRNWHIAPLSVCENPIPLAAAPKKDCFKACTKILAPVCATDGQTYHIFNNKCLMEEDIECNARNWHVAPFSVCENPIPLEIAPPTAKKDCLRPCPLNIDPVCATDGQTYKVFDNKCMMEMDADCYAHNWHIAPLSVCENPIPLAAAPKKNCNVACPDNYSPICAFDGKVHKTFPNECTLEAENCLNDTHFVALFNGECRDF